MKTKSYSKIALLLVLCLTALLAIGISASAEDAPVCKIESANVAYNDMLQLAFTVKSENLDEGAEVGIIAWEADVTEFTVATAFYATFTSSEKDGYTYYKTRGIAAPEMDTPIYVAACYRVGEGEITVVQDPVKYSVLQYAGTRLTATNVTAKQAELYQDTIEYGMASDAVLEGEEEYAFVKAVNGTVGSAGAKIGGWLGKEVLLRAEAKNANDEYFIKWIDADGNTVSTDRLAYVTVEKTGITEYTAVFGSAADSIYDSTYNFENLNGSLVALPTPNLAKEPTDAAYNTTYYKNSWKVSKTLANLSVASYMAPKTEKIDGVNTLVKGEDGLYSIAAKDVYSIYESLDGDKELAIDRDLCPVGYTNSFTSKSGNIYQAVEFDISFDTLTRTGIFNSFNITLKDANSKTVAIRTNLDMSGSKVVTFSDQKATNAENNAGRTPFPTKAEAAVGATITVKAVINTADASMTLYANGVNLGTLPLVSWGAYKNSTTFTMSENITISTIGINCESGNGNDIRIDNVTFLEN